MSGLVGNDQSRAETKAHNARFTDPIENARTLNTNIANWLIGPYPITDDGAGTKKAFNTSVFMRFQRCLQAPTYNIFSNTESQKYWIEKKQQTDPDYYDSLESPHNSIHLAVGGMYVKGQYNADNILGANGDMGENDTAAMDPIFFLHHCFIDHCFWKWQQTHGQTQKLDLDLSDEKDPGLKSVASPNSNNQPTANHLPDVLLTLDTPLDPFFKPDTKSMTSKDVIDIENQLGYTYGPSSLDRLNDPQRPPSFAPIAPLAYVQKVHNLHRGSIAGSFVIELYAKNKDGEKELVGREAILSRWGLQGCKNCQEHLETEAFVPFFQGEDYGDISDLSVEVITRAVPGSNFVAPHLDPKISRVGAAIL